MFVAGIPVSFQRLTSRHHQIDGVVRARSGGRARRTDSQRLNSLRTKKPAKVDIQNDSPLLENDYKRQYRSQSSRPYLNSKLGRPGLIFRSQWVCSGSLVITNYGGCLLGLNRGLASCEITNPLSTHPSLELDVEPSRW